MAFLTAPTRMLPALFITAFINIIAPHRPPKQRLNLISMQDCSSCAGNSGASCAGDVSTKRGTFQEGLGLFISQRLVKIMNGTVQYLREAERSSFIVLVEFPLVSHGGTRR
ncbi:Phytochrome C [Platanthera guangdongensis]|uniref:Phytochrome C n=1 Tax=Platanthera guangdongensis TaxID=2320717 RepID=A0ABR2MBZ9_9ASPA